MKSKILYILIISFAISMAFSTSYLKNISITNQKDYVVVSFQINGKDVQYSLYPYVSSISIDILFANTKNALSQNKIISTFQPLENIQISEKASATMVRIFTNAKIDYKFDTGTQSGKSFTLNLYLSKKTPLIDVDYTGGKFSTLDSVLKEISKMLGRNIILSPDLDSMKVNLSLKNVKPTDLFNMVLSSVATDIGYTVLNNGSYYVAKISNIIKKYSITLASLALKLSKETTYKIVVDPAVRDKMITYNSEDFSPKTILNVISLINGVAYTFIDKDILYISSIDKIEKMFSSNYIVKTYNVPSDFDPTAIKSVLSPNAKIIKITDTSILLKGLSKDHVLLKTILSNIKSKKTTYEIIKTNINPSMLKALKEVFKNVGLVQIKDKLLLTGDPTTIENIKKFLNNFSNDNYIQVVNAQENSKLISDFINKYFPEITANPIKNLVVLSGPKDAIEGALNYVQKIESSLSQVATTTSNASSITSVPVKRYKIQVVESSLSPEAVKSIITQFEGIKILYNNNGKFILYGQDNELQSLKNQLSKIQKAFSTTVNATNSKTLNNIVIKEYKIPNLNSTILENVKKLVNPTIEYFYSKDILIIKADQNSIETFMKYIQYFVPNSNINQTGQKEIIKDYYLNNLDFALAKQILGIYYENLKIDYIPELKKIILKGNKEDVTEAIEKLNSLSKEIGPKNVSVSSTTTKWLHFTNLKPTEAEKIVNNYAETTKRKIKTEAIDSTGYLMITGNEKDINYLSDILTDMDSSEQQNHVTTPSTKTLYEKNKITKVSTNNLLIDVKEFPLSDLIYTASKLLSKNIITKNLNGTVSLSISSITFENLLKLLQEQGFVNYTLQDNKYIITGKIKTVEKESIATIVVGYNVKEIAKIVPTLFNNVQTIIDTGSQTLILKGPEENIKNAEKLINELSNGNDRINISIKITSQDISNKKAQGNSLSIGMSNGNSTSIQNGNSDSQYLGFNLGGNKLELSISKLRNSSTNIISQPNVVTINGKTVKIHIGQSFSKIINQNGAANPTSGTIQNTQSVKQFNTGVILSVTPIILSNGKILLNLDLNVSKITGFNDGIPVTENKQVTSTIIINNGQTVSFGGLEEVSEEEQIQKLPFLGDLPLIGSFFSSSQNIKKKYDLTFEITATISN